jgi:lysophospholipase L1-like esterase
MLPANYRLVNLALPDATAQAALVQSLPTATSLHPALATVWLNVNDILNRVPVATYQSQLTELLHGLRAAGAEVLVANTPPVDELPAYLACTHQSSHGNCPPGLPQPVVPPPQVVAAVTAYNLAIAAVAAQEGAIVVDLHGAALAAQARGTEASLVAADGFNPSVVGAQMIASQFAAALHRP